MMTPMAAFEHLERLPQTIYDSVYDPAADPRSIVQTVESYLDREGREENYVNQRRFATLNISGAVETQVELTFITEEHERPGRYNLQTMMQHFNGPSRGRLIVVQDDGLDPPTALDLSWDLQPHAPLHISAELPKDQPSRYDQLQQAARLIGADKLLPKPDEPTWVIGESSRNLQAYYDANTVGHAMKMDDFAGRFEDFCAALRLSGRYIR
jgi:hypothetical protein